jgi:biopolymer transport protein ExbD
MAMSMPAGDEDEAISTINTTPLVDVMLVLLIIFLITVPVITANIPLELPEVSNLPSQTKPEDVTIAIDAKGKYFWGVEAVTTEELFSRIKEKAVVVPQPEFHIRADRNVRYEFVGRAIVLCQRGGIAKVGFTTQPQNPTATS